MLQKQPLKRPKFLDLILERKGRLWFSLFFVLLLACKSETATPPSEHIQEEFREVPNPYQTVDWSLAEAKSKLQPGDILLKCGMGHISNLILKVLEEPIPLSHCAFVAGTKDSLYMIHSISGLVAENDGVQTIAIDGFLNDLRPGTFYALRHKDSTMSLVFANEALGLLNSNIRFDHDYNHRDSSQLYCSEMANHILSKHTGKRYFGLKKIEKLEVLSFNEILSSEDFIILNRSDI